MAYSRPLSKSMVKKRFDIELGYSTRPMRSWSATSWKISIFVTWLLLLCSPGRHSGWFRQLEVFEHLLDIFYLFITQRIQSSKGIAFFFYTALLLWCSSRRQLRRRASRWHGGQHRWRVRCQRRWKHVDMERIPTSRRLCPRIGWRNTHRLTPGIRSWSLAWNWLAPTRCLLRSTKTKRWCKFHWLSVQSSSRKHWSGLTEGRRLGNPCWCWGCGCRQATWGRIKWRI